MIPTGLQAGLTFTITSFLKKLKEKKNPDLIHLLQKRRLLATEWVKNKYVYSTTKVKTVVYFYCVWAEIQKQQ